VILVVVWAAFMDDVWAALLFIFVLTHHCSSFSHPFLYFRHSSSHSTLSFFADFGSHWK
jgi:hypothetical protein